MCDPRSRSVDDVVAKSVEDGGRNQHPHGEHATGLKYCNKFVQSKSIEITFTVRTVGVGFLYSPRCCACQRATLYVGILSKIFSQNPKYFIYNSRVHKKRAKYFIFKFYCIFINKYFSSKCQNMLKFVKNIKSRSLVMICFVKRQNACQIHEIICNEDVFYRQSRGNGT